eukprot:tig00001355_g8344.t1
MASPPRSTLALKKPPLDLRVYLVTDRKLSGAKPIAEVVRAAIQGGVTIVQYRDKDVSTRVMCDTAAELLAVCREHGVPFLINDRIDVALAVGADGVHVGQDDMPLDLVRRILPPHMVVGCSTKTITQARLAQEMGADYLGVGAVFGTTSKADTSVVGVERIGEIASRIVIPVVGIGGISAKNAADVVLAGAKGVAVISAVINVPAQLDPYEAAKHLRSVVDTAAASRTRPVSIPDIG